MQTLLAIAAIVAIFTGIVHSALGERLIFRHLRSGSLVPSKGAAPLLGRHVRILWATWHLASVFGWALAAILFWLAVNPRAPLATLVASAIVAAYAGGALLVLLATRGRHPGWLALAAVAALTWIALGGG